tara:strand:- start:344 stop:451 length:108 start_codon:yes stop_codon:yes gene_type:complete
MTLDFSLFWEKELTESKQSLQQRKTFQDIQAKKNK